MRSGVDLENDLTSAEGCVIGPAPFHAGDVEGAADAFGHVIGDHRCLLLKLQRIARDVLSILLNYPVVGQYMVVHRVVLADSKNFSLAPNVGRQRLGSKFDDEETA